MSWLRFGMTTDINYRRSPILNGDREETIIAINHQIYLLRDCREPLTNQYKYRICKAIRYPNTEMSDRIINRLEAIASQVKNRQLEPDDLKALLERLRSLEK